MKKIKIKKVDDKKIIFRVFLYSSITCETHEYKTSIYKTNMKMRHQITLLTTADSMVSTEDTRRSSMTFAHSCTSSLSKQSITILIF